jgi:hypothetical protein
MEINYEMIIKYLSPKKTFSTQKSIYNYASNFPEKFKQLLNDTFYRYGVTIYDSSNKNNISFWTSLLSLIDKNFITSYSNDELSCINDFKNKLLDIYKKSNLSSFLRKFDKNDLRERFKLNPDITVLQYIVDVLDINIIIFSFDTNDISTVFSKDIMNPFKQTFLLAKHELFWEPIMSLNDKEVQRTFDYNDLYIKNILDTNVNYFEGTTINKDFIMYSINDIISLEKDKLVIPTNIFIVSTSSNNNKEDSSVKTESDTETNIKDLNKTKLNKMKVHEVTNIINKLKIKIDVKISKVKMIELILEKIKIK